MWNINFQHLNPAKRYTKLAENSIPLIHYTFHRTGIKAQETENAEIERTGLRHANKTAQIELAFLIKVAANDRRVAFAFF